MANDTVARVLAIVAINSGGGGGEKPQLFPPKIDTTTVVNEVAFLNAPENGGFDATLTATLDGQPCVSPIVVTGPEMDGQVLNVIATREDFESNSSTYTLSYVDTSHTYLTITDTDGHGLLTLSTSNSQKLWNGIIEYSIDHGNTWAEWDGVEVIGENAGINEILLRGTGNTHISGKDDLWGGYFRLDGEMIVISGYVESLLDYAKTTIQAPIQMDPYCFNMLFADNSLLYLAPSFYLDTLSEGCYASMFSNCSILHEASELPATYLAKDCYRNMFNNCTAFETFPDLLSNHLAEGCYAYMFNGCANVEYPPYLPATILAKSCYESMFGGCEALRIAPELPATVLAESCYQYMFSGCTSLDVSPYLPATVLAPYCYTGMFNGCTALNTLSELPAETLVDNCYSGMFYGCTRLKIYSSHAVSHRFEFRIPAHGIGVDYPYATAGMFAETGGKFTGDPVVNTTYYVEDPPVNPYP